MSLTRDDDKVRSARLSLERWAGIDTTARARALHVVPWKPIKVVGPVVGLARARRGEWPTFQYLTERIGKPPAPLAKHL